MEQREVVFLEAEPIEESAQVSEKGEPRVVLISRGGHFGGISHFLRKANFYPEVDSRLAPRTNTLLISLVFSMLLAILEFSFHANWLERTTWMDKNTEVAAFHAASMETWVWLNFPQREGMCMLIYFLKDTNMKLNSQRIFSTFNDSKMLADETCFSVSRHEDQSVLKLTKNDNDSDNDTLREVPLLSNEGLALQERVQGS